MSSRALEFAERNVSALSDLGDRWNTLNTNWLQPILYLLLAGGICWLVFLVLARALSAMPSWYESVVRKGNSRTARVRGYAITAVTAAAFSVWIAVWLSVPELLPSLVALAVVSFVIAATFGIINLAFGMATRPRLDATVLEPSGKSNAAWSAELLAYMRDMNADDPKGRVERPSSGDLNDVIAVANGAEHWFFKFIGSVLTLLLNLTPWRLDVTIFNTTSGSAILRRNGHVVKEELLRLQHASADSNHPTELLMFAAAFGGTAVAAFYPDITGLYRPNGWRGIGLLAVARASSGAKRNDYIRLAIEADPRSILIEYEDVYSRYDPLNNVGITEKLIDRLEPMINVAAILSGRPSVLTEVKPRKWHRIPNSRQRNEPLAASEPPFLLLRLMTLYTTAVRNYSAGGWESEVRRERAVKVVGQFMDALLGLTDAQKAVLPEAVARMKQRAALCYLLLEEPVTNEQARRRYKAARRWEKKASKSPTVSVRYSYACYLARRASCARSTSERSVLAARVGGELESVRWNDTYRAAAVDDPELKALGHERPVREAVLHRCTEAWAIDVFAKWRDALTAIGVAEPENLAASAMSKQLHARLDMDWATASKLVDYATILAAAMSATADPRIDQVARLRTVHCLLDSHGHSTSTLASAYAAHGAELVDAVAASVFWVPKDDERKAVGDFLAAIVDSLGTTKQRPSRAS